MEITTKSIRHDNQVIPLKNLSSAQIVSRVDIKTLPKTLNGKGLVFWLGLVGVLLFFVASLYGNGRWFVATLLLLLGGGFVMGLSAMIVNENQKETTLHGVELLTNSGKNELFWHPDEDFVKQIAERIFAALEGEQTAVTINLDNRTIQNKTTVNNYFDYGIHVTKYDGVSPEQMAFFQNELSTALTGLGQKFEAAMGDKSNEQGEALAALRQITEELNTKKPDRSRIRKLWDAIKNSGEIGGFAADVASVGRLIGDGLSILS